MKWSVINGINGAEYHKHYKIINIEQGSEKGIKLNIFLQQQTSRP